MNESERKEWLATSPNDILLHGPTKIYLDEHLWFYPSTGIVGSYQVQRKDVRDHFDVFRGVDMIESAGQTGVSACSMLFSQKEKEPVPELQKRFIMAFLGLGNAVFHDFVSVGETLINICPIHQYKFRQIRFSATVYKTKNLEEAIEYFNKLKEEEFLNKAVPSSFSKVAEFANFTGRAVNRNKI